MRLPYSAFSQVCGVRSGEECRRRSRHRTHGERLTLSVMFVSKLLVFDTGIVVLSLFFRIWQRSNACTLQCCVGIGSVLRPASGYVLSPMTVFSARVSSVHHRWSHRMAVVKSARHRCHFASLFRA